MVNNDKKAFKYDWKSLEKLYYKEIGNHFTAKDFAKKYKVSYSTLSRKSKKWNINLKKIDAKTTEKTIEQASDAIAKANTKHLKDAMTIREWAHKYLFTVDENGKVEYKLEPKTAKEVIDALKLSMDMEREILGLNKNEIKITFEQVNIMFGDFVSNIVSIVKEEITDAKVIGRISERMRTALDTAVRNGDSIGKEVIA